MEQLLEQARRVSDQSEVFFQEQRSDSVSFENGLLKNIESRDQSGISLRLIRDGHLGFAYTRNLHRPEELVQNALATLPAGVEARYALPERFTPPDGRAYDPAIENLSNTQMVEEGQRLAAYLGRKDQRSGESGGVPVRDPGPADQQPGERSGLADLQLRVTPFPDVSGFVQCRGTELGGEEIRTGAG